MGKKINWGQEKKDKHEQLWGQFMRQTSLDSEANWDSISMTQFMIKV